MSDTNEVVSLRFNTQALTTSLRYAFAHSLSAVLELVQNARRAGADTVTISTGGDGEHPCLTVSDNGRGISSFQVLLDIATSGWDETIAKDERPYGLGFLSALYSAPTVHVISRGRMLRIDTGAALSAQAFKVEACNTVMPAGVVTMVKLIGFDTRAILEKSKRLFRGYPIRVVLDEKELDRPHAIQTSGFVTTEVGHVRTANIIGLSDTQRPRTPTVYLQGFCVMEPQYAHGGDHEDVVHLDSTKWFGKFPDRNTVVNPDEMLRAVNGAITARYRSTLLSARSNLPEPEFVTKYYGLASSLGMLEVFNDIDIIPAGWLSAITELPFGGSSELEFLGAVESPRFVTRADVESGAIVVADLQNGIYPECQEQAAGRRWVHAYARGALVLSQALQPEHWVYRNIAIHDETDANYRVSGVMRSGKADSSRLRRMFSPSIVICEQIESVSNDGIVARLNEPVADEEEDVIYIPVSRSEPEVAGSVEISLTGSGSAPQYVNGTVLRLLADYFDEDQLDESDLESDERAINEMARELMADSPEQRLAMALQVAIASFSDVRNIRCELEVDAVGAVKVCALKVVGKSADR